MTGITQQEKQTGVSLFLPSPLAWWQLLLPFAGFCMLAAHYLRAGDWGMCAAILSVSALSFTRYAWARLVSAVFLLLGSLLWVNVGMTLVQVRVELDASWMRLAVILSCVTVVTVAGSLLLASQRALARFTKDASTATPQTIAFFLTGTLLWICREKVSFLVPLLADRFLSGSGPVEIVLVSGYAAVVCRLLHSRRRARKVRGKIWLFFSVMFFGQLALGLMGVEKMLMTGSLHLPVPALIYAGPLFRGSGFFMAILFTVSVLLVGPAWCSHLCYIGAWDDQMSRRKKRPCSALPHWGPRVRMGIAVGVLGGALVMRWAGVSGFVAAVCAGGFGLVGVWIMVSVSARKGIMVHCSAFCPMGVMSNLLGKISFWRLRISDECTLCGACTAMCRYDALGKGQLEKQRPGFTCTLCRDCTTVCKHNAISLTFAGISSPAITSGFIVMIVSLHAVFLAVARM